AFAVGPALATPTRVEGKVIDANTGDAITDCAMDVLLDGNTPPSAPPPTGTEGSFALDLTALFGAKAARATTLVLEFRKSGYTPVRRCLTLTTGSTSIETQDVRLAPTSGASSLDAALKKQLDGHKSPTGRTVYLFQYMVPPGVGNPARDTLTWMLSW